MFDDYWELIPRSQDSAGKSSIKPTYQRNSNYRETFSGGSQNIGSRSQLGGGTWGSQVGPTSHLGVAQGGPTPSYG